ncbi:carbon storage regulator [Blastopirellula retiformator]|uniref:carbon storage regulator n=1 Tax=Blastopirellula retiformator TaxID=2527970 RepID=UPI0011B65880|nr:carbon storage regulator [Blastopirellula retiformator]
MLVLTRKPGETIRIGDDIVITINQLRGGRVRVGIDAPKHVSVACGELDPPSQQQLPPTPTGAFQPPQIMGFAGAA